ncbi:MAG: alpha-glucuronidase family glycosyl hydrolase, partial [Woeseiaceae bacterium]
MCAGSVVADDGYQLWLDYGRADTPGGWQPAAIVATPEPGPSARAAAMELRQALGLLYNTEITLADRVQDRAVIIGTPESSPAIAAADLPLDALGGEGYVVRSRETDGERQVLVAANSDVGLVYGSFALLRALQTGGTLASLDLVSAPRTGLRLLNHWDNLDGTVERGYAGESLWDWWRLPDFTDPRYIDYARANASLGINGTVLNNVNSNADILTPRFLEKVAALADVFRPWGLRVYLSARFSAPMEIGGLDTADPLEPAVRAWWQKKTRDIYALIPDFGGFLVKANSEGQPGPQDYGRSHADGANMLAAALEPHGGVVMWRAFVYAADNPEDRAKQAYDEFVPLDGEFADNVLIQVKNGPIDFQPREPFHPLFGAMPETPLMMEFQVTKEYLGFSTHLAYLAPLYQEVLAADTFAGGEGSTVASVIDGSLHGYDITGVAGVSNIGDDRDWSGSIFNQADWFAFGRLAWNPGLGAAAIARDWLAMTFTRDPGFVEPALTMMMRSREAVVDYMTPLGLAHLMGTGHHYGPAPWVSEL